MIDRHCMEDFCVIEPRCIEVLSISTVKAFVFSCRTSSLSFQRYDVASFWKKWLHSMLMVRDVMCVLVIDALRAMFDMSISCHLAFFFKLQVPFFKTFSFSFCYLALEGDIPDTWQKDATKAPQSFILRWTSHQRELQLQNAEDIYIYNNYIIDNEWHCGSQWFTSKFRKIWHLASH